MELNLGLKDEDITINLPNGEKVVIEYRPNNLDHESLSIADGFENTISSLEIVLDEMKDIRLATKYSYELMDEKAKRITFFLRS